MKIYRGFNNKDYYTEAEIRSAYEDFKDELPDADYESYLDRMLAQGVQKVGGLIEIEANKKAKEIVDGGYFDAAVGLMDEGIREKIHRDLAPCTDEEFLTAYMYEHEEKYGEEFTI